MEKRKKKKKKTEAETEAAPDADGHGECGGRQPPSALPHDAPASSAGMGESNGASQSDGGAAAGGSGSSGGDAAMERERCSPRTIRDLEAVQAFDRFLGRDGNADRNIGQCYLRRNQLVAEQLHPNFTRGVKLPKPGSIGLSKATKLSEDKAEQRSGSRSAPSP
jgi:hypothetical protein